MINKAYNLVPYFVLTLVLTIFFVWLKSEERTEASRTMDRMTQRIGEWRSGSIGAKLNAPLIVDVRNSSEFAVSHCAGAINIPSERMKEEMFLIALDRKTPLMVYSRSMRISAKAVEYLKGMDYSHVYNLNEIDEEYAHRDEEKER